LTDWYTLIQFTSNRWTPVQLHKLNPTQPTTTQFVDFSSLQMWHMCGVFQRIDCWRSSSVFWQTRELKTSNCRPATVQCPMMSASLLVLSSDWSRTTRPSLVHITQTS